MYCPNCGTHCEDTHHFCYICGTNLPKLTDISARLPADEPETTIPAPVEDLPEQAICQERPAEVPPESAEVQELPAETDATAETEIPAETEDPYLTAAPSAPEAPAPKPKKGRIWPPVLMMAIMICAGLALFLFGSGAEAPTPSATPWFTVEDGTLSFHADQYTGSEELTIPASVDGQTVTAIADNAFNGCDNIATVILPETVTKIGDYAFSSCSSLRGIYIPETVTHIGVYAFSDCDALEAIYLPGSLETLGHGSLDSCDSLHYILFNGTYDQWNELYAGYFTSSVELHTIDGTYYSQP